MGTGIKMLLAMVVVFGLFILVVGGLAIGSYNSLVACQEGVQSSLSQIDNQLQRRNDLIPNLVETVKGYAGHEEGIFKNVSEARAKLAGATTVSGKAQADAEMTGALGRLLAIAENYPQLKADANFRQLSDELAGTENRIATARRDYNNAAQTYNTRIRKFPASIIAGMFDFSRVDYFEAEEGAKAVPQVKFN